jgi:hypothetical protein
MADTDKKKAASDQIAENQRFRYIGFEVYPGKPKDLFKSEAERDKLVETVRRKRESGDVIREECTLLEKRVTMSDRIVMTLAALAMLAALFMPWFAVYNEIEEEVVAKAPTEEAVTTPSEAETVPEEDLIEGGTGETEAGTWAEGSEQTEEEPAIAEAMEPDVPAEDLEARGGVQETDEGEEVIHGYVAKKKVHKEYDRVSGIGAIASIGSVGGKVFGSGFVLVVTGILMLLAIISAAAAPLYSLYGIFGLKGDEDTKAVRLKKMLRLNWLPLILFSAALVLSFIGAEYGFDAASLYGSLGDSYGVGVFLGTLSWGPIILIGASLLLAGKGIEI